MRKIAYLWALCTCLFACQSKPQTVPFDETAAQQVKAEAEEMMHAYHAAIQAGGLLAEEPYLDSTDQFFWVPPGYETALNYDSVWTILSGNAPGFQQVNFHWESLNIHPLSFELATFNGIVKGSMVDTAGQSFPVSILESGTLIKRTDGWKLLSGQSVNL